jgi:MraZ protein
MAPGRLDDKGRLRLNTALCRYFECLVEKKLFVTSLDRRTAQIYPMAVWRENEKFFETYREKPALAKAVAFNAADLGAETEMDTQGRVLFSPELRRELGLENQALRVYAYRGRIEILTEAIYEERKRRSTDVTETDVEDLQAAGLN